MPVFAYSDAFQTAKNVPSVISHLRRTQTAANQLGRSLMNICEASTVNLLVDDGAFSGFGTGLMTSGTGAGWTGVGSSANASAFASSSSPLE